MGAYQVRDGVSLRLLLHIVNQKQVSISIDHAVLVVRVAREPRDISLSPLAGARSLPHELGPGELTTLELAPALATEFADSAVDHVYVQTGSGSRRSSRLDGLKGKRLAALLSSTEDGPKRAPP